MCMLFFVCLPLCIFMYLDVHLFLCVLVFFCLFAALSLSLCVVCDSEFDPARYARRVMDVWGVGKAEINKMRLNII